MKRSRQHHCNWGLIVGFLVLGGGQRAIAQTSRPAPSAVPVETDVIPASTPTPTPNPSQPDRSQPNQPQPAPEAPPRNPNEFPPNPLELRAPDPLLPAGVPNERSLTAAERRQLEPELDKLNAQAQAQSQAGDRFGAYDTWNRELRLRRFLGPISEVQALGRVGDNAWRENEITQVRWITRRLDELLIQALPPPPAGSPPIKPGPLPTPTVKPGIPPVSGLSGSDRSLFLDALGQAHQLVRQPASAVLVYEQILSEARQQQDGQRVEATLITLGQLHLSWFDYAKAAAVYQELLAGARATNNQPNEVAYLTQLAFIYEQAKQPQQAIEIQQQLVALYQQRQQPEPIPSLTLRIADNYQQLGQLDRAEQNYQATFQLAQSLFQFGFASDALQRLAALYRANDRLDAALRVYDFLLGIEQQAYNYYGMMAAYDQLGQIHVSRREFPQAIAAFQRGLELAKQLKYREDYFAAQIQQISQQTTP
jgi:tetratricopeptide (TPR) repeat protein